jgi:hypothetical protein
MKPPEYTEGPKALGGLKLKSAGRRRLHPSPSLRKQKNCVLDSGECRVHEPQARGLSAASAVRA